MCKPFQHFIFNMLYNMLYGIFERFAPGLTFQFDTNLAPILWIT